jgi:hypothetical protein
MNAFMKLFKGILKMPVYVRLWLIPLAGANMVVPLVFLDRLEARVVLGAAVAGAIIQTIVVAYAGFTRLLGLGHILWFPLIYFLWERLGQIPAVDFFGVWVRVLMMINAAALAIDVIDVIRYIYGDREETVSGL